MRGWVSSISVQIDSEQYSGHHKYTNRSEEYNIINILQADTEKNNDMKSKKASDESHDIKHTLFTHTAIYRDVPTKSDSLITLQGFLSV